ncbi:Tad domain-containing protein [Gemmatimonas groenlandica]|uniref:Tad domain-containing protein n=1 Tax=Gemmatimonas groenlandica TaxID=2732249 RepID=UPI00198252FC|nr:Tad domain-containing protein [Gemmatimonas groenlandica]
MFVAVFALALVGLAAFAIDLSRLYVGTNELQTGADAAALRGALQLQYNPGTDPSGVTSTFAASNQALNQPVTLGADDVKPVFWDPDANPKATILNAWTNANAVQVTASRSTGLLFGRIISTVSPAPQRRAIAWIANVASSTCLKPWGMPMSSVLQLVGASASPIRPLTSAELVTLRNLSILDRTIIIAPPYSGNGQVPNATPNGNWNALRINGNGMRQYQDAVEDVTCSNTSTAVGADESDKPGNNIDSKTTESIVISTCRFQNGSDTCFDLATGTVPGVSVLVAYTSTPVFVGNGSSAPVTVAMMGEFVIQCYRRGASGGNGNGGGNGNNGNNGNNGGGGGNTCTSSKVSPAAWSAFSEGTLLGYVNPDFADLRGSTTLGNQASIAQRLILVR